MKENNPSIKQQHKNTKSMKTMTTSADISRDSVERRRKSILIPENLSVEEFLTQQCDQLVEKVFEHSDAAIRQLWQEFAQQKKAVLDLMEDNNQENEPGTQNGANSISVQLVLSVTNGGAYAGKKFELNLRNGKPCMLGRSSGRNFTKNGVSLSKDPEVSTTHAKIELDDDCAILFTDCGSTNGTMINDTSLDENTPIEIKQGDKILIGATTLIVESLT